MQINMSGHHIEITDSMRKAVNKKLKKIESHHPKLDQVTVLVSVEKNRQQVNISTQYLGANVTVKAAANDLYEAIPDAASKLDSALGKRKTAASPNRNEKYVAETSMPIDSDTEEEFY